MKKGIYRVYGGPLLARQAVTGACAVTSLDFVCALTYGNCNGAEKIKRLPCSEHPRWKRLCRGRGAAQPAPTAGLAWAENCREPRSQRSSLEGPDWAWKPTVES